MNTNFERQERIINSYRNSRRTRRGGEQVYAFFRICYYHKLTRVVLYARIRFLTLKLKFQFLLVLL